MDIVNTELLFRANFYTALYDSHIDLIVAFNDTFVSMILIYILVNHKRLKLPEMNVYHRVGLSIGIIGFSWQTLLSVSRYLEVDTLSIGWMMWSLKDFGVSLFLIGCLKAYLQRRKS